MRDRDGRLHRQAGRGGGQFMGRQNAAPDSALTEAAPAQTGSMPADLTVPESIRYLAQEIASMEVRDAVLQALWGSGVEADSARFQHDWATITEETSTAEQLTIAASNRRVPIGVILRHPAADRRLLQAVLPRVHEDDVVGGRLEADYVELIGA